jgi:hypothetical protein
MFLHSVLRLQFIETNFSEIGCFRHQLQGGGEIPIVVGQFQRLSPDHRSNISPLHLMAVILPLFETVCVKELKMIKVELCDLHAVRLSVYPLYQLLNA